jgi:protein TonB
MQMRCRGSKPERVRGKPLQSLIQIPPANIIWATGFPLQLIFAPDPEFTDLARRKRLEGTVVVALTVDTAGKPQDVRVARSLSQDISKKYKQIALGLDDNAVAAVKQYRFQPAQFQGKPVPVETKVEVNFRIC